jgi:hypothetical protein
VAKTRTLFVALVAMLGFAGTADAQIVTITATNYVAGPPPKADPQGTWSVPPMSGSYKVEFDYGAVTNGTYTVNYNIGLGGTVGVPIRGGNGTWGPIGQEPLMNPLPANTHVRARLMKQNQQGTWDTVATVYSPLN